MPTTALYHWSVAGCPVNILIELPVVERLRAAAFADENEIGGLLIGSFDGNYTIISDFEEIKSEHRRGVGYQLSSRDERKMVSRIESWARRKQSQVVGLFRSHRRPGLYLDESDSVLLSSYFHNAQQVELLVKPESNGRATGGFFFWEDGNVDRKQTYLPFPMDARELEDGDFPLVEPVNPGGAAAEVPDVAIAASELQTPSERMDGLADEPIADGPIDDWKPARTRDGTPAGPEAVYESAQSEFAGAGSRRTVVSAASALPAAPVPGGGSRLAWRRFLGPAIGAIAAIAAMGIYVIGTSGSHRDRFGSRPGDIAVNTQPPEPVPASPVPSDAAVKSAQPPPAVSSTGDAASLKQPKSVPAPEPTSAVAKPIAVAPLAPKRLVKPSAASPQTPARSTPEPESPATAPSAVSEPNAVPETRPAEPVVAQNASPAKPPGFAWSHYAVPGTATRPAPRSAGLADAAVSVETVESGGFKRVAHHIPLFGSIGGHYEGGEDFKPAQVVHSFAPKVPPEVARSLTGPIPVDLKLKLDKTGKVRSVELISKQLSPELTELAGGAAYHWQFEPAHVKDKNVASEVIAHFRFRPAL